MLADVNDVAKRAGAFLDDPSNSIYTLNYLMPFIDLCYDELDVDLERAGMQYIESIAVVDIAANISDLTYLLQDGEALATMKFPKFIKWKLQGWDDYQYQPSAPVVMLDEVIIGSYGALQYTFMDGAIQVTPSSTPMTLKIYFDQMSTNIVDPSNGVIRGTAHILAAAVAAEAAGARKGMEKRAGVLAMKRQKYWNAFKSVLVQNNQGVQTTPPPMHGAVRRTTPVALASQAL